MDNINVIRVGFMAPEIKIADCEGEIDDPISRSGECYTCLVLVNNDSDGLKLINRLESGLPRTSTGFEVCLSIVMPLKTKIGKATKTESGFQTRLFCDNELRIGKAFSVIDSSQVKPSYHPVIFIVGEDGSVRYRQVYESDTFNADDFRKSISQLI